MCIYKNVHLLPHWKEDAPHKQNKKRPSQAAVHHPIFEHSFPYAKKAVWTFDEGSWLVTISAKSKL